MAAGSPVDDVVLPWCFPEFAKGKLEKGLSTISHMDQSLNWWSQGESNP
jgi:hypothetical protein